MYRGVPRVRKVAAYLAIAATSGLANVAMADQGDMGTGIPQFGTYAAVHGGGYAAVASLGAATIPMKSGCTRLYLYPATWGVEGYKIALATLMAAKVSGRRVRLYSHADTGCEVDFIELQD